MLYASYVNPNILMIILAHLFLSKTSIKMSLRTHILRIFIQGFSVEHIESINRESMNILNKMEDILKTIGELKMNADIFDMNHDLITENLQRTFWSCKMPAVLGWRKSTCDCKFWSRYQNLGPEEPEKILFLLRKMLILIDLLCIFLRINLSESGLY